MQVMVHCMSGVSRSPSVVIAYLMKCNQWPLVQSLRYLEQRRPCVKLTPPVQEQLLEFERQVRFRPANAYTVSCSSRGSVLVGPEPAPSTYQVFGRNFSDMPSPSGCCSGTATVHLSSA